MPFFCDAPLGQARVSIFIPTYANHSLLQECLISCIQQDFSDIEVVVLDNGAQNPDTCARRLVKSLSDPRIKYLPNYSNIGSQNNFRQALYYAKRSRSFICIPADVFLTSDAVSTMVNALQINEDVSIVFGRTISRNAGIEHLNSYASDHDLPLSWPYKMTGVINTSVPIKWFFSSHNISSEWSHFSFIGSLIDSSLIRALDGLCLPYSDHGVEIYMSLLILLYSQKLFILDKPVNIHYTSAQRFGSAIRPPSNYTRIEPLHAQYDFLNKYAMMILRCNLSTLNLRVHLLQKCLYTILFYSGNSFIPCSIAFRLAMEILFEIIFFTIDNVRHYFTTMVTFLVFNLRSQPRR